MQNNSDYYSEEYKIIIRYWADSFLVFFLYNLQLITLTQ